MTFAAVVPWGRAGDQASAELFTASTPTALQITASSSVASVPARERPREANDVTRADLERDDASRDGRGTDSRSPRPAILALVSFYPPAFRAGGPPRTVPRIVDALSDEFRFGIVTRDGDLGVATSLAGVVPDRWMTNGRARCLYLSPRRRWIGGVLASVRRTRHDALYLNSLFSFEFSFAPLLLRRVRIVPHRGLVIAPRGELDARALAFKRRRKRLYIWLARTLGLLAGATWHAASENEEHSIYEHFGRRARVAIAPDIPPQPGHRVSALHKEAGRLDIVFLSRIARMKNLDFAISVLREVKGIVNFDVFGPIEDHRYWAECERAARALPDNVTFRYRGVVQPDDVSDVLQRHHLFLLPTQGESFGHAIVESLMAGCPVLISDLTRWRDLQARRCGWDLPLSRPDRFSAVIDACVRMDEAEFLEWVEGARLVGREAAYDPALDAAYRRMFRTATEIRSRDRVEERVAI